MKTKIFAVLFTLFFIHAQANAAGLKADLIDTQGLKIGTVTISPAKQGVLVQVKVQGLSPGEHGIHIHENGKCETPDFKTAGSHFNPAHKHHGLKNAEGPHAGDLPNLNVRNDGSGELRFENTALSLGKDSLSKVGGTSVVIHAKADDEKSDPAGNSGDRVACGVLRAL